MDVIRRSAEFRAAADAARSDGRRVGLVPTMGAFHDGHLSLIRRAREETGALFVTVFVNPLQFGEGEDLATYPRDEDRDLALAEALGADAVFAPSQGQMFPAGLPLVTVDPGPLGDRLEGASRPAHFRGVLTAVARLFHLAGSCRAYFGEKDSQQLALVWRMIIDLAFPVEIAACPTVREPTGLALSSRNAYLSAQEHDAAGCLFEALAEAAEMARAGERDVAVLIATMAKTIGAQPLARLDYVAVVDDETFDEVRELAHPARALVAARIGDTRLIDNVRLEAPARG